MFKGSHFSSSIEINPDTTVLIDFELGIAPLVTTPKRRQKHDSLSRRAARVGECLWTDTHVLTP
jgi:hypothetical protein